MNGANWKQPLEESKQKNSYEKPRHSASYLLLAVIGRRRLLWDSSGLDGIPLNNPPNSSVQFPFQRKETKTAR